MYNINDIISFDIETYDPNLKKMGPGVYRKDGYVLGVAIVGGGHKATYYDIGHPHTPKSDRDRNRVHVSRILSTQAPKVGANILYDMDWLVNSEGIEINGRLHDIQIAGPLLDEYRHSYSLDTLAKELLLVGKAETELLDWCTARGKSGAVQEHLSDMPVDLVGRYAITDAALTLDVLKKQLPEITHQSLSQVYDLECALLPMLLHMRKTGVRINGDSVDTSVTEISAAIDSMSRDLVSEYGDINYRSTAQLATVFDTMGIDYPMTAKGNPSITNDFLETLDTPLAKLIQDIKVAEKTLSTFLLGALTNHRIDSRIHCQFVPLRGERYGSKSGRLASANPNLQNIPSRNPLYAGICRRPFIPEEGCFMGKWDWSQIEYRFIAHYATGKKSDEIRRLYNEEPGTDYHAFVMELTGLERKPAKNLNFGTAYFMGAATCAKKFGWNIDKAKEMLSLYYEKVPFIKSTRERVVEVAKGRGYIRTILGRRARVNDRMRAEGKEHSMFNRLIQGSAADLMKQAMVDAWDWGIFDILNPHLVVHDEFVCSIPKTKEGIDAAVALKKVMETAIKINVPIIAELEIGDNWYDVKGTDKVDMLSRIQ